MHLQNPFQVLLGLSSLLSVSAASPVISQRQQQQQDCVPNTKSPPFHLRVVSSPDDERLNNTYLVSSHSGPPFRQLVTSAWYKDTYGDDYVPNETSTRFYLNGSSTAGTYPCPGSNLAWEWNSDIADATLRFRESRTSNSWVAYLFPGLEAGSTVDVGFDDGTNKLYLVEDNGQKWYRWAICDTVWGSYKYESLVWVVGSKGPDNESCKGVDVVREWV